MMKEQADLLRKAQDSLVAAKLMLEKGFPDFAASRGYYSMFYVAEAYLEGKGLSFSKHSAVIAIFGKEFCHSGRVPVEFHRELISANELRHIGDYSYLGGVSADRAQKLIGAAEKFIKFAVSDLGQDQKETE